jgi:hypothetical protein
VWYYTSDAMTHAVREADVLKCEAYMLMYKQLPLPVEESIQESIHESVDGPVGEPEVECADEDGMGDETAPSDDGHTIAIIDDPAGNHGEDVTCCDGIIDNGVILREDVAAMTEDDAVSDIIVDLLSDLSIAEEEE